MKISYTQFARCLGVSKATISVNVSRGKLIADEVNKTIDYDNEVNWTWIQDQVSKGKTWDLNRIREKGKVPTRNIKQDQNKEVTGKKEKKTENKPLPEKQKPEIDPVQQRMTDLKYKQQLHAFEKSQFELKQAQFEFEKRSGKLIPYDEASKVFRYSAEQAFTVITQGNFSLANIYVEKLGVNEKLLKDIQKRFDELFFEAKEVFLETFKTAIDQAANEYQEVRSRGERK